MPSFDATLVQPAEAELAGAMLQAVETANKRCRVGKLKPDQAAYRQFVHEEMTAAEGVGRWLGGTAAPAQGLASERATLLGVAWWTDPLGRKHVRVAGRRIESFSDHYCNCFVAASTTRPPLWLVYPERLFLRTLPGGKPELLALCRCGASGTPEALGWMGETCGPCHDHQQEFGTPLARLGLPLELGFHEKGVRGVAWSESGQTVVAAGDEGVVRFSDPATGTLRKERRNEVTEGSPVAWACNGHHAIMASFYMPCQGWHAEDGAEARDLPLPEQGGYDFLALSPDGQTLAAANYHQVEIWSVPRGKTAVQQATVDVSPTGLAFRPDSQGLAVGTQQSSWPIVYDLTGDAMTHYPPPGLEAGAVLAISFSPDSRMMGVSSHPPSFANAEGTVPAQPVQGTLEVFDSANNRVATLQEGTGMATALAFSPDGKALAAGCTDRLLRFWEMPQGRPLGSLEWHLGTVQTIAFSPDGQSLASGGVDGYVRLWPWKRLLADA
jgi:WD40 repeat protein